VVCDSESLGRGVANSDVVGRMNES
jgi:hypothetical protein